MNKTIHYFIDMDGVIASFDIDGKTNATDFEKDGIFFNKAPVMPVIKKILEVTIDHSETLHILSAAPGDKAINEKNAWLDKHFNVAKQNRHFVNWPKGNKRDFLESHAQKFGIAKENIVLIDDTHSILHECEKAGFKAVHPSYLLTWK